MSDKTKLTPEQLKALSGAKLNQTCLEWGVDLAGVTTDKQKRKLLGKAMDTEDDEDEDDEGGRDDKVSPEERDRIMKGAATPPSATNKEVPGEVKIKALDTGKGKPGGDILSTPRPFGVHFKGIHYRFKKGNTPITDPELAEFLSVDPYVKDNGAEMGFRPAKK